MNDRDALERISLELFGDSCYSNREVLEEVKRVNEGYWQQEEAQFILGYLRNLQSFVAEAITQLESSCRSS